MKRIADWISIFLLLLVMGAFLLVGCQSISPILPPAQDAAWGEIELTPQEKRWLQNHPTVIIHYEDWPPFMLYENGEPAGIAIDMLNQLLAQVNLQPKYVKGLWADTLQDFQGHTGPDILPVVGRTPEREEMMLLTSDYISFPMVIFTQKNAPFIGSADDLTNHIVAVERSYSAYGTLMQAYPQIQLLVTDTTLEALEAVSTSKADAYIGNLAVASYLIEEHGLVNLKVAAPSSFENHKLAIGIHHGQPELAGILEKALKAMPEENRSKIQQKWLSVRYEYGISQKDVTIRILTTVLVATLILGLTMYSNWRLAAEMEEKEKTRLALQNSESLLRTVIDATPNLIFVKDRQGTFLLVNRFAAAIYDLSPEEMQGLNEKDFIDLKGLPPEDINAYLASDKQVFDTGTVFIQPESPIIRPGKPVLWFETIKIPLETNGIVDKVLVVRADVTDRKNTLEALKAERANLTQRVEERTAELVRLNIELQESSRAKDEFLANMSHELRTPLNAILGMSEILQEQLFGDLNEKQLKQVNVIEESGRHLLTLINDILDLAKIVSGQRELAYQPVNITDLCKSSLNFINSQAIKKNITVSFEPLNELTEIEADPRSVKQILINLLSNAVKFTPENGHIGLRVEQDSQNELVCFTVWDTGIGITLEQSLKLFMPFVQVDSSLARKYAGTGLGLSLISRLVDMHGGSVQLKSGGVHGKGSQFTIHLPLHPTRIQTSLQPEFEDEPILLIDDEPNSRIRMQTILAKLGCRVRTAKIDDETIRIAHEIKPKLIFIDLQTPQETSLQTIHQMRQELGEQSIPVLCMTSLLNQKNPDLVESFGTYEYLLKPVSPKLVRLLLNKYLREY